MKTFKHVVLLALLFWVPLSFAELAVIVHKSNTDTMSADHLQMIFLGKTKGFPTSGKAVPLDLPENSATRAVFLKSVAKKSPSQFTAYWAKLMFTGKGVPPKVVDTEADMVALVAKNPNIIGFVDAANVTADVRVVAKF